MQKSNRPQRNRKIKVKPFIKVFERQHYPRSDTKDFLRSVTARQQELRFVTPNWSIQPKNHEHALLGRLPFEALILPQKLGFFSPEQFFFNRFGRKRVTDNTVLETSLEHTKDAKREETDEFNQQLRVTLEEQQIKKLIYDILRFIMREIIYAILF